MLTSVRGDTAGHKWLGPRHSELQHFNALRKARDGLHRAGGLQSLAGPLEISGGPPKPDDDGQRLVAGPQSLANRARWGDRLGRQCRDDGQSGLDRKSVV